MPNWLTHPGTLGSIFQSKIIWSLPWVLFCTSESHTNHTRRQREKLGRQGADPENLNLGVLLTQFTIQLSGYAFQHSFQLHGKESEVLSYLHTSKQTCHSVAEAARCHEMPGSETKELMTPGTASSPAFMFLWFPLGSWVPPGQGGPAWVDAEDSASVHHSCSNITQSFIIGCKQAHPTFTLEGDIIFITLGSKQTCPPFQCVCVCWGGSLSLFSQVVHYIIILEKGI